MIPTQDRVGRLRHRPVLLVGALALVAAVAMGTTWLLAGGAPRPAQASRTAVSGQPEFGPHVLVFSPSMPQSRIQAQVSYP
jgi:hypothetical protein